MTYRIDFPETHFAPVEVAEAAQLSECLTVENSPVLFGCRTGICGSCLVEVSATNLLPPNEDEKEVLETLDKDPQKFRLACQMRLIGNIQLKKAKA